MGGINSRPRIIGNCVIKVEGNDNNEITSSGGTNFTCRRNAVKYHMFLVFPVLN